MKYINLSYDDAERLITEGDVLIFRGQGWVSKLLGISGQSSYTHVAIASWVNGTHDPILELIEMKEFKGGRSVNLRRQVEKNNCRIDVYRPVPFFSSLSYNEDSQEIEIKRVEFDGKLVTGTMRRTISGMPYSWKRIWWLAKKSLVGFRLFFNLQDIMNDEVQDIVHPVCSTAIAYSFSVHDFDLINNKSDEHSEPGDIARSGRLNYLFTLCNEEEK